MSTNKVLETFGPTLLKGETTVDTATALAGKTIGVYFSAHWCPPCRAFTPKLIEYYNMMQEKGKQFEMIFVSSDRDFESWKSYYGEMPWLALEWASRNDTGPAATRIQAIKSEMEVSGIPLLVFLKEDGSLITKNGRDCVSTDPEGASFPYIPPPLSELIAGELIDKEGTKYDTKALTAGKKVGIYFSAHWCPPCRGFTPTLAKLYSDFMTAGRGEEFEIIYASGDSSQAEFDSYLSEMPWKAIPFTDKRRLKQLDRFFDVQGIPHLVILDEELNIINDEGRTAVMADPTGKEFPWPPKALSDLEAGTKSGGHDLNNKPSIMVFMENLDDEEQSDMESMLLKVAVEYFEEGKTLAKGPKYIFFTNKGPSKLGTRIRDIAKVQDETKPRMILIDIRDKGAYYTFTGDLITEESLRGFIADFEGGRLSRGTLN